MYRINKVGILAFFMIFSLSLYGGNRKIMSINAAKITAERGLVETIYGLKLRSTEEVKDLVGATFVGKSESKTAASLKGVKYENITYDPKTDIAQADAVVKLDSITNVNGSVITLGDKTFKRTGFGTSSKKSSGALKALRAAEIDAYKQLMKQLIGFKLESQTTVENYILKSDSIKTKVMATLFLADVNSYGWDKDGNAFIKMSLNIKDVSEVLGQKILSGNDVFEVEGLGAQEDDYSQQ